MLDRSSSSIPVPDPRQPPLPPDQAIEPSPDDAAAVALSDTARRLVERELAAFNSHDLDTVASLFAPTAQFITGHRGPPIEGPAGVRFYVADQYARFPGLALDRQSCSCVPSAPAGGDGSPAEQPAQVQCQIRWRARWHDRATGRLLHRDGGADFVVSGDLITEVRLHTPQRNDRFASRADDAVV